MAQPPVPVPPAEPGDDPSMDDILASIRRILSDEEKAAEEKRHAAPPPPPEDVLMLDSSMMVPEPVPETTPPLPLPAPPLSPPPAIAAPEHAPIVAPEAAAAAASSVGQLMRTLATERGAAVRSGGPTIEDLVREELRPLLKQWLDAHLPPLVERLVRAEIERVVGRSAG
jgi:cell pole-organizing protein PopZ